MPDDWTMGALAAQDQYQPLGNDPWTNTMAGTAPAPGQGFAPVQQSPVLYQTKAGPITEADIGTATEAAMGVSGGGLATKGIKAYHSSPHDFDKFDLSKIGSGEGAQVYGHGLYFAENPAVSGQGGQYWQQFQNRFPIPEATAAEVLSRNSFNREKAMEVLSKSINADIDKGGSSFLDNRIKALQLLESGKPVGPRTYEVNINADPAQMLDWDKRFFDQSPQVQEALTRLGVEVPEKALPRQFSPAGRELYGQIANPPSGHGFGKARASQALSEAGIPGIKYLDAGSRFGPQGQLPNRIGALSNPTHNYVIFDPAKIDIMKKYGLAGATAGTMGALAAQDQYNAE